MRGPRALALSLSALCVAAAPVEPVPDTLKQLRDIETHAQQGTSDNDRLRLEDQIRERPNDPMLRIELAWTSLPSDDAWNTLKGIATIHPEIPWVHLGMGRIYSRWKMWDQSEGELNAALKADAHFYPALTERGDAALARGRAVDAERSYRAALAVHEDGRARAGLGLALIGQGQVQPGRTELSHGLDQWPDQADALLQEAKLAREDHDGARALKVLNRLMALTPKDAVGRRQLADLELDAGDAQAAAKDYERLLRLAPAEAGVLKRLAAIYRDAKNTDGEEHALQQLSSVAKDSPDAPLRLAELAAARGALDEAEGQLLEADQRTPHRADILFRLGGLQLQRDELKEARESFLAAQDGSGEAPSELAKALDTLTQRLKVPKKPAHGTMDQVYWVVSQSLAALYAERLREKPGLAGTLRVRVKVDADGQAKSVEIAKDSLDDAVLQGHVYFALKDAGYAKQKREPQFEFDLKPPKKK